MSIRNSSLLTFLFLLSTSAMAGEPLSLLCLDQYNPQDSAIYSVVVDLENEVATLRVISAEPTEPTTFRGREFHLIQKSEKNYQFFNMTDLAVIGYECEVEGQVSGDV